MEFERKKKIFTVLILLIVILLGIIVYFVYFSGSIEITNPDFKESGLQIGVKNTGILTVSNIKVFYLNKEGKEVLITLIPKLDAQEEKFIPLKEEYFDDRKVTIIASPDFQAKVKKTSALSLIGGNFEAKVSGPTQMQVNVENSFEVAITNTAKISQNISVKVEFNESLVGFAEKEQNEKINAGETEKFVFRPTPKKVGVQDVNIVVSNGVETRKSSLPIKVVGR